MWVLLWYNVGAWGVLLAIWSWVGVLAVVSWLNTVGMLQVAAQEPTPVPGPTPQPAYMEAWVLNDGRIAQIGTPGSPWGLMQTNGIYGQIVYLRDSDVAWPAATNRDVNCKRTWPYAEWRSETNSWVDGTQKWTEVEWEIIPGRESVYQVNPAAFSLCSPTQPLLKDSLAFNTQYQWVVVQP